MGFSVSYKQILRLETSLAHTVYDTALKKGTYIPRRLQKGTLVHFAVDNIDFQEDTVDGRNTFHGTITVAFQPGKTHTATSPILEVDSTKSESLPETIYSHQKKSLSTGRASRRLRYMSHKLSIPMKSKVPNKISSSSSQLATLH